MREQFSDYTMHRINDDLSKMLANKDVNVFKLFAMKEDDIKLSVTLLPLDAYNNRYHGLHPKFDESRLRRFLYNKDVNNVANFWEHVLKLQNDENDRMFDLIFEIDENIKEDCNSIDLKDLKEIKRVFLGRSILQMISHYGIIVNYSNSATKEDFLEDLNQICESLKTDINLFIHKPKDNTGKFVGIWPIELIERIQKKYEFVLKGNKLELIRNNGNLNTNMLRQILTFQDMKYFQLVTGGVYYSGVMPRVMGIDFKYDQASNSTIKHLSFKVCRTTFATVDMMDNAEVLNHYFFTGQDVDPEKRNIMDVFGKHEDQIQEKYLFYDNKQLNTYVQREYETNEISRLNEYLKLSFNTHTVAVSCNIKTTDNFLIAAQRDEKSIDAGEFYCSANGQSEFMDKNVTFYKESVFEDLPSMNYNSDYRVDLNNEIRREVIAELGITALNAEWNYLGVSYLAINQLKKGRGDEKSTKRRMHFNVLTLNKTSLDFKSVVLNQKHATESFENSKVIGIQTVLIGKPFELLSKTTKFMYEWINRNKSRVFLILFFISFICSKNNDAKLNMNNVVDITLLSIYIILTIYGYIKDRKYRTLTFIKRFYLPLYCLKSSLDFKKLMVNLSKKAYSSKNLTFHGIFILMYLLTLVYDE